MRGARNLDVPVRDQKRTMREYELNISQPDKRGFSFGKPYHSLRLLTCIEAPAPPAVYPCWVLFGSMFRQDSLERLIEFGTTGHYEHATLHRKVERIGGVNRIIV